MSTVIHTFQICTVRRAASVVAAKNVCPVVHRRHDGEHLPMNSGSSCHRAYNVASDVAKRGLDIARRTH